jgi:hypothetical protein
LPGQHFVCWFVAFHKGRGQLITLAVGEVSECWLEISRAARAALLLIVGILCLLQMPPDLVFVREADVAIGWISLSFGFFLADVKAGLRESATFLPLFQPRVTLFQVLSTFLLFYSSNLISFRIVLFQGPLNPILARIALQTRLTMLLQVAQLTGLIHTAILSRLHKTIESIDVGRLPLLPTLIVTLYLLVCNVFPVC